MPHDYAPNTLTFTQAAALIGMSRTTIYATGRSGSLLGVPVLRVGRRLAVPTRPLAERLGMTLDEVAESLDREPREPTT